MNALQALSHTHKYLPIAAIEEESQTKRRNEEANSDDFWLNASHTHHSKQTKNGILSYFLCWRLLARMKFLRRFVVSPSEKYESYRVTTYLLTNVLYTELYTYFVVCYINGLCTGEDRLDGRLDIPVTWICVGLHMIFNWFLFYSILVRRILFNSVIWLADGFCNIRIRCGKFSFSIFTSCRPHCKTDEQHSKFTSMRTVDHRKKQRSLNFIAVSVYFLLFLFLLFSLACAAN